MNVFFNYKGQKFKAELSDNPKNARIVLNLMWSLVDDDDSELSFMPNLRKLQTYEPTDRHNLIKALTRKAKKNGSDDKS